NTPCRSSMRKTITAQRIEYKPIRQRSDMAVPFQERNKPQCYFFKIAPPAIVVTCPRNLVTLPLPSGWTRLLRKMTADSLPGSIQMDVPVKPVWPKLLPDGKALPRLLE